ncbi:DUF1353 domain-containing protein [Pseudoprimorskyibacter insulae]|uniref:DUF1353 domain-containing protein n=1 Tax=Pseudoprimorskyibacter insulae TaxID=1695997 RepID=A0A2R8AVQ6_9RHOB|nr:DUF1353 domain-containing protein [Pseudoprimorskyibacter insulae]SPF80027.1 hypothetical protein PRI8871_01829 [Pseudoprimorskyibacter insulae]
MYRIAMALSVGAVLVGCAPGFEGGNKAPGCEMASDGACFYVNSPVRLSSSITTLPGRPYPFRSTLESLQFVDSQGGDWLAPEATLTDGASIPPAFIESIGLPNSPQFVNAAVIHDAYCGVGNEEGPRYHTRHWKAVHRTFYEALRVGGTDPIVAKVMYAAVLFGGPRWTQIKTNAGQDIVAQAAPLTGPGALSETELLFPGRPDLAGVPVEEMVARFERIKDFIERNNPPVTIIEGFVQSQEAEVKTEFVFSPQIGPEDEPDDHHSDAYYDEIYYQFLDDLAASSDSLSALGK